MEPFRVELSLSTNRIASDAIHLDGLLAAIAVELAQGDVSAADSLPLEQYQGVYKASYLFMPVLWRDRMSHIRKADFWQTALDKDDSFSSAANQFSMGSGPYKAYLFSRSTCQSPKVVAYGVGDIDKVSELLAHVRSVGPLQRLSAGLVATAEVFPDKTAGELWQLRNMPHEIPGYEPMIGGLTAPYWKREHHQTVWVPTRSMLRPVEQRFAKSTV